MSEELINENSEIENQTDSSAENGEAGTNFDISQFYSDDIKGDADFERISKQLPTDPKDLVKDLYNKTKHFGKARDQVKAELEKEYNKTYGADDYKLTLPDDLSEDYKESLNSGALDPFKQKALELGIKPEAFNGLMNEFIKLDQNNINQSKEETNNTIKQAESALKEEWGQDYDQRLGKAEETFKKLFDEDVIKSISKEDFKVKIGLLKAMDKLSGAIDEKFIGKQEGGGAYNLESIEEEMNRIRMSNEYDSPEPNIKNPLHKRVLELTKQRELLLNNN